MNDATTDFRSAGPDDRLGRIGEPGVPSRPYRSSARLTELLGNVRAGMTETQAQQVRAELQRQIEDEFGRGYGRTGEILGSDDARRDVPANLSDVQLDEVRRKGKNPANLSEQERDEAQAKRPKGPVTGA